MACYACSVPSTVYNSESHVLLVGFRKTTLYNLSNTKFSIKYFNIS